LRAMPPSTRITFQRPGQPAAPPRRFAFRDLVHHAEQRGLGQVRAGAAGPRAHDISPGRGSPVRRAQAETARHAPQPGGRVAVAAAPGAVPDLRPPAFRHAPSPRSQVTTPPQFGTKPSEGIRRVAALVCHAQLATTPGGTAAGGHRPGRGTTGTRRCGVVPTPGNWP